MHEDGMKWKRFSATSPCRENSILALVRGIHVDHRIPRRILRTNNADDWCFPCFSLKNKQSSSWKIWHNMILMLLITLGSVGIPITNCVWRRCYFPFVLWSISRELFTRFAFCEVCGWLVLNYFTHIFQGCITGTGATMWSSPCHWNNLWPPLLRGFNFNPSMDK